MQSKELIMDRPPVVLLLSGMDPTGSAGILADARVISSLGCHPCGIITCETVQTSHGLTGIVPADAEIFYEQIHAVLDDLPIKAVKIGAVASVDIIEIIGRELNKNPEIPVVLDPVFAPTSGPAFLDMDGMRAMSINLLEQVIVATPNVSELGVPAGLDVHQNDEEMMLGCASGWFGAGVETLLVTGIKVENEMVDKFIRVTPEGHTKVTDIRHPWHNVGDVHGSGCILSSAIAGHLARGEKLSNAVKQASELASGLIENAVKFGGGAAFWIGK